MNTKTPRRLAEKGRSTQLRRTRGAAAPASGDGAYEPRRAAARGRGRHLEVDLGRGEEAGIHGGVAAELVAVGGDESEPRGDRVTVEVRGLDGRATPWTWSASTVAGASSSSIREAAARGGSTQGSFTK
jgi:hypothetical protein